MGDTFRLAIIVLFMPLVIVGAVGWLLRHFVALQAPPTKRAAWLVGPGYLLATALMVFSAPEEYWWVGLVAPVPASLLLFWWWRRDFRQRWFDDDSQLPEDAERENDDWRVGLIFIVGLIVIAAVKGLAKLAMDGQL